MSLASNRYASLQGNTAAMAVPMQATRSLALPSWPKLGQMGQYLQEMTASLQVKVRNTLNERTQMHSEAIEKLQEEFTVTHFAAKNQKEGAQKSGDPKKDLN